MKELQEYVAEKRMPSLAVRVADALKRALYKVALAGEHSSECSISELEVTTEQLLQANTGRAPRPNMPHFRRRSGRSVILLLSDSVFTGER